MTSKGHTFQIVPRSVGVVAVLAVLGIIVLGSLTAVLHDPWSNGMIWIVMVPLVGVFLWFLYSSRCTKFIVSREGVRISGTIYGRSIPANQLRVGETRRLDVQFQDRDHSWRDSSAVASHLGGKSVVLVLTESAHSAEWSP